MFALIVGLAALIVASCAAFFSVQGLATLYAGKFISVCIMAGGLEFGKLIAASYLHRYWDKTSFLLKTYLIIAVITLMGVTSLGIFGFLTSAYQENHSKVEIVNIKQSTLDLKRLNISNEITSLEKRIQVLNDVRLKQEQRVIESGNYKAPRDQAYAAIEKSNIEIKEIQLKVEENQENISSIDEELIHLKTQESSSTDIGTLKFVSQLFNKDISTIVKWFTILIVFVFDPLAISLVLAYNNIVTSNKKTENVSDENIEQTDINPIIEPIFKNIFKKSSSPVKIKYQDKL
jgi:hypothetical protein